MNISPLSPVSLDSMVVNGDDTKEPELTQESAAAARCTYTHTRHTCMHMCWLYSKKPLGWEVNRLKKINNEKKKNPVQLPLMRWLRPYTDIDYVDSGWFSLALFVCPACWLQLLCAFCGNTSAMQCRLHTVSWYHNKSLPYALCNMTDFVCIYHSVWSQHMFLLIITCVKLAVNYLCFF